MSKSALNKVCEQNEFPKGLHSKPCLHGCNRRFILRQLRPQIIVVGFQILNRLDQHRYQLAVFYAFGSVRIRLCDNNRGRTARLYGAYIAALLS
jgi:hypothetical protein